MQTHDKQILTVNSKLYIYKNTHSESDSCKYFNAQNPNKKNKSICLYKNKIKTTQSYRHSHNFAVLHNTPFFFFRSLKYPFFENKVFTKYLSHEKFIHPSDQPRDKIGIMPIST